MASKTPAYIQQTSTLNAVNPHLVTDQKQQAAQLSSIVTDLTLLMNKVNLHEKQISTLVSQ